MSWGRRVLPRKYAYCFDCQTETIQWLWSVTARSPGSYRGTRIHPKYICTKCGEIEL